MQAAMLLRSTSDCERARTTAKQRLLWLAIWQGVGIFQITVSAASGVTAQQASDPAWAADWAARYLSSNMTLLAAKHPNFTGDVLLQATAASYNLGPNKFSGDPDKIDTGSKGTPKDAYGANVMQLMECFR